MSTLAELSAQYRQSAKLLGGRLAELRHELATAELRTIERQCLQRRICILAGMRRDAIAISHYLENYYKQHR